MRQSKPNKGMGHDLVPGELLHHAAPHLASKMWPVLAKMAMWVDEPLQWKGGRLVTAYKNKGSVQECGSYRALLVSSIGGGESIPTCNLEQHLCSSARNHGLWLHRLPTVQGFLWHKLSDLFGYTIRLLSADQAKRSGSQLQ